MIKLTKYAGTLPGVTIIVDGDPQDSGEGPYVPWSVVSDVGERVLTAATAAIARQALGIAFAGNPLLAGDIVEIDEAYELASGIGLVLANSDSATFDITVPRALVNGAGDPVLCLILKTGNGTNPILIKDDLGAVKMALIQGGQAMCFVVVISSTVYANGVA